MIAAIPLEQELQHTVIPFFTLMQTVCKIGGVFILLHSFFSLKEYGEKGADAKYGLMTVAVEICLSVLIWNLTDTIMVFDETIFGTGSVFGAGGNPLAYPTPNVNIAFQKAMPIIHSFIYFLEMAGILCFVRGLFIWHQSTLGYKHSTFWKGFWHCLGGILAFHFDVISAVLAGLFSAN